MAGIGLIIGIITGFVLLVVAIWFFSSWNRLINLEENVNKSWADIDVLLKQRYDMIPNLVNMVKGYAKHEKDLFMEFAKARQSAAGALSSGDVQAVGAAESVFSGLMPRINMVSEQYPELKANASFINLQNQLVSLENQVADRREFYNSSVTSFNKTIQMIPTVIVANFKGCERRVLFEVTAQERENVVIEF